jgi:two-component system, OmpR family, phosphate regulon sensor histidine kinase PhoR
MKRKVIRLIVIFSSISLLAALITQLLWVKDALHLKDDLFAGKVELAMNNVVNQILSGDNLRGDTALDDTGGFFSPYRRILKILNPFVLDSLLQSEFKSMRIESHYVYGVYNKGSSDFVMGNFKGFEEFLIASSNQISLSCLCDEDVYFFAVEFPQNKSKILSGMILLPVMSGLFLMVLVFSFFFTIYTLLKQKKLEEMKTDFLNNMTHEFKTPIATILVSSEILMQDKIASFPERVKKYAKIVFEENERLKNLVERVLLLASMEKESFKPQFALLDVHSVIQECLDNFRVQVSGKKLNLVQDIKATSFQIMADRLHVYHVINNLLDNAFKYSPENPEIAINTKNDDNFLLLEVQDNGIGISHENKKKIFEKFHRLQRGDVHDVKGFGIGLYYVKSILEKMGATISVESELNNGSKFTVKFPLSQ